MSRKMDHRSEVIAEYKEISREITEIGRRKRAMEAKKSALEAQLIKSMGRSKVGTLDGKPAIEVYESSRRSAPIANIEKVCPELAPQIVVNNVSTKIKVFDV